MKKTLFILSFSVLALLAGCGQTGNKPATADNSKTDLPAQITTDTIQVMSEMPVTSRFLSLIQYIDTSGYVFDTLRYTPCDPFNMIQIDKYILFEIDKEMTLPFRWKANATNEEMMLVIFGENVLKDFDITLFEKAQKVIQYYFKQKQPDIRDGQKWYADGLVEEWTFNNETDARQAVDELEKYEGYIYLNTGAFICGTGNRMYVFHSRASAFMYKPQKQFFQWFVEQNSIKKND